MPRLTPSQQRNIIRNAARAVRGSGGRGVFEALGRRFGAIGDLVGMLGDILFGGRRPNRRHVEDAVPILSQEGFQVSPGGPPEAPPVIVQPPPLVCRVSTVATPGESRRYCPARSTQPSQHFTA